MEIRFDGKLIRTASAKTTEPIYRELVQEPVMPANHAACNCEYCRISRTETPTSLEFQPEA
jgi:hypothetical protein